MTVLRPSFASGTICRSAKRAIQCSSSSTSGVVRNQASSTTREYSSAVREKKPTNSRMPTIQPQSISTRVPTLPAWLGRQGAVRSCRRSSR